MANRTGQQLGNYRLVRFLGQGGFADVYLGEHVYLKSYAALKVLHRTLKEEDVERFLSEAQTLVQLRHANIVRVLEFIFEQGTPVLVMDYAPGGTARQRYPSGSCLPLATTVAYVRQVAAALQYAHNHSIIHRDVKPDNILFDSEQQILLGDFGLALFAPSPEQISTQEWVGTIPYMAPEQLQGKPTFASDQYALGIVTYEWLCGVRPFEGDRWALMHQHLFVAPPPLREKCPGLPASVEGVVLRALAKDPQQRFPSIQAFVLALERASRENVLDVDSDSEATGTLTPISPPPLVTVTTHTDYGPQAQRRVFLAAAPADEAFAVRLQADLQARGIGVSRAPEVSTLNQPDELRQVISDVPMMLVVLSPDTRSSRTIKEQLRIVSMYQQRLVFVRARGDDIAAVLPEAWGRTALIDLVDARGTRYTDALAEIIAFLKEATPVASPEGSTLPMLLEEPRNPYKGLRAFTKEDAVDFFGRDGLIEELAETIEGFLTAEKPTVPASRLLTVIGPSGSGKSSVVMAGLLPGLQKGALAGSQEWVYLDPIVPGKRPLELLILALAPRLPERSLHSIREDLNDDSARGLHLLATQLVKRRSTKVVLMIDQFEELFTQTLSEQERQRFIDLLVAAVTEPGGPLIVLLTLRADFYDRPMHYPQLSQLIEAHQKSILPMNPHELRAVIEQPAVLPDVQLLFEDNLVGDLLFEAQGQAGALPLLEFTLDQLFHQRDGHWLTRKAYRQIGGVKGALAKHAESTYASLPSEEHRRLARALFLRLIEPGATEQDTTRRRAALSELSLPDPQQTALIREVADAFVAARLLTTNEVAGTTTIEVSHEALIREWSRLAGWLHEAREDVILQQAISADAAEWARRSRPEDRLYRGTQLVEAQAWTERNVANTDEVDFLQAGIEVREQLEQSEMNQKIRELSLQRRVINRQRLLVAVLSIFSVIVIAFASLAEVSRQQADLQRQIATQQRNRAELQAQISLSRALAANASNSLAQNELDQALLLSVKANQVANTFEARNSLLTALEQSPQIVTILHSKASDANTLTFGSDGNTLISADIYGIYTWNIQTRIGNQLTLSSSGSTIGNSAFSAKNQMLVTANPDGVWLWDSHTGVQQAQLEGKMQNAPPNAVPHSSLAFSSDGKLVAYSRCNQYATPSPGNLECIETQISIRSVQSRQLVVSYSVHGDVNSIAFSPDNTILASSSNKGVQLTSADTGQPLNSPTIGNTGTNSIAFSPDSTVLAYDNGTNVQLWNLVKNQLILPPLTSHTDSITGIAFSPDGKTLASSSKDKTVVLWDLTSKTAILTLTGNAQSKSSVAFSPDGKMLASGSQGSGDQQSAIILWHVDTDSTISQRRGSTGGTQSAVLSPDGTTVFTGSDDGKIYLHDVKTGNSLEPLNTITYPIAESKNPADNNLLLQSIQSLALSRNQEGKVLLAAGRLDGTILLWDIKTRTVFRQFLHPNLLYKITLNSDGRILAASGKEGTITLWDVTKGTRLRFFQTSYQFSIYPNIPLALSPDGKFLAIGSCGKVKTDGSCGQVQVLLQDVGTGKPIGQPLLGHQSLVLDLAFGPDGHILASSSEEGIILWNVATSKRMGPMLSLLSEDSALYYYSNILFSPDGKMLASYSSLGTAFSFVLWDVTQEQPFAHAISEQDFSQGSLAFSPDGQQLVSVVEGSSNKASVMLWDISIKSWEDRACIIANRNLTPVEWNQFLPNEAYRNVCPNIAA